MAAPTKPIYVVDDELLRALVREVLGESGYAVREADSGRAALAAMAEEPPALVVLDVMLPGISGYEVCHELRALHGDQVAVLFISGERTEPVDRVAGLLIGGDDYLVKPFAPDELVERVRSLLRRAGATVALRNPLTDRELEVLQQLAEGLDQNEIARRLFIAPRTVGTHIEHILPKLGVHSRAQAVAVAYRSGLLGTPLVNATP